MKYIAAKFGSKQQSEKPYQALQETLRSSGSNASVFRAMLDNVWHIIIMGDHIDTAMQRACDHYLPERQRVTLKEGDRIALENRRKVRTKEAKPIEGKPGTRFAELHEATRVTMDGYPVPATPGDLTSLAREEAMHTTRNAAKPFTSTIISSPPNAPLIPGSKVKMQVIPFIKGYQEITRQREIDEVLSSLEKAEYLSPTKEKNARLAIEQIQQVNERVLKMAVKYRFTPSAIAMHKDVFSPESNLWVEPGTHVWIELDQAVNTPYGEEIKAVYVNRGYPVPEIDQVAPPKQDAASNKRLHTIFRAHKDHWTLNIITARCANLFDLTYSTRDNQWVFLASHLCPYNACQYPVPADLDNLDQYSLGACIPCDQCKAACLYWSSWLRTALLMCQGYYAISPEKPEFEIEPLMHTQEEIVNVGHGKNKRRVSKPVTRHLADYRIVKYEVSLAKPASPEKAPGEKKPNWLTLHEKDDLIYEKRLVPVRKRHYTATHHQPLVQAVQAGLTHSPTNGEEYILQSERGEIVVIGKIKAHEKYFPLLKPETRKADTIKKVTASRYQESE